MRINRVFFDVDMRKNFDGLRALAKEADTDTKKMTCLFINAARTSFKMMTNDKYLVYYTNGGRRIPVESLRHLPQDFGGSELEMDNAIEKSLREKIKFLDA